EPSASMDRPGANVWAATFHQMMAERKPRDTWMLLPEDSLVAGRPDHGCFQYRLKGLAGLQCGHCPWGWGSAHVQVLFHLWWDEESRKGLVKMRVWGQQCRLCPLGTPGNCQVSPLSVRPFLNKLALHVLRKCYGESPGPDQCPGLYYKAPGDAPRPCEACILVSASSRRAGPCPCSVGLTITVSGGEGKVPRSTQLLTLAAGPRSDGPGAASPSPLSVSDFIKNPLTDSSHFFSKGEGIITIPFSLADDSKDKGPTGTGGPVTIGKGSLCLSSNSMAIPKGKGIPVNIKDPIFHGKGLLISNIESKGFELKGFIFKGKGSISDPIDIAKVQGLVYNSEGATAAGKTPVPVSYIIGLMANGEGSITFPLSFTNIIKETSASGSATNDEGAITFPFIFTDGIKDKDSPPDSTEGKEKENGGNGPASPGRGFLLKTNAAGSVTFSEGSITIPFSVFNIIKRKGPSASANGPQNDGFLPHGYSKKKKRL
uniref:3CxxC-type domain-containing protein n=1 Tax=Loxodonta africana TaxID=9785 RepID=G3UE00_LOXAF